MLYHAQSDDYRPLFWMGGKPIYANTLVLIGHIAAFVIAALCISFFGFETIYDGLALSTPEVWHLGQVWRLFGYVAFDPAFFAQRSLWFLVNMALMFFFGREVEQFVGRTTYLKLYAALVIVPALLFCLLGLFITPAPFLNCCEVFFGMFIAFATIYPGAMPSFWIPLSAAAFAWILLGISSLIDIAVHDFSSLFMIWMSSGVAYFGMRVAGAGRGMDWLTDWIEERRTRKMIRESNFKIVKERKATESIDAILDKISKHGVGSLDSQERAALERARTNLLKRDRR